MFRRAGRELAVSLVASGLARLGPSLLLALCAVPVAAPCSHLVRGERDAGVVASAAYVRDPCS